jgi:hypothetical protein
MRSAPFTFALAILFLAAVFALQGCVMTVGTLMTQRIQADRYDTAMRAVIKDLGCKTDSECGCTDDCLEGEAQ